VDRFAAVYTPAVFVIALAVALLGPWLLDWTWMQAIYKALVLLVIACPCALVISTPVTIVSGLAAAARRGILIKGGIYLEGARNLKAIALDKTGTITEGKPKLVARGVLDTHGGARTRPRAESIWPPRWPVIPITRCRAPCGRV
jgi:Cd2+/Zn2+-exporting ATPase